MKICIIGLGSIGCRHLKNIVSILNKSDENYTIDALRSRKTRLPDDIGQYITTEYYDIAQIPSDYDIIFVTNPTVEHFSTIKEVVHKSKNLFIEKPVFSTIENEELLDLRNDGVYYVACPMRHKIIMKKIQEIVKKEKVFSARAICSSFLPDWRPKTDYRKCYSARQELGGGVTLDLIHEWDYIIDLFGFPTEVNHIAGKYSNLEINADDLSVYIARYEDKVVEIHLDYFGRKDQRKLSLYCENYVIEIDFLENVIIYNGITHEIFKFDNTDQYVNEMRYFFDLIKGKSENINSIQHAIKVLELGLS